MSDWEWLIATTVTFPLLDSTIDQLQFFWLRTKQYHHWSMDFLIEECLHLTDTIFIHICDSLINAIIITLLSKLIISSITPSVLSLQYKIYISRKFFNKDDEIMIVINK